MDIIIRKIFEISMYIFAKEFFCEYILFTWKKINKYRKEK